MPFTKPERTDLVINMTLAEIFLLLLFVVWYGHTPIMGPGEIARLKEQVDRLEKENQTLKNNLRDAKDEISDLKQRLEWWRRVFPTIDTTIEGKGTPEEVRSDAGRGFRRCQDINVLIRASVIRGQQSMVWITESPQLTQWITSTGRDHPRFGVRLTDPKEIDSFLSLISDYYHYRKEIGIECRFDYQLTYATKEDYYDGRERFEKFFYPSGIKQLRVKSKN